MKTPPCLTTPVFHVLIVNLQHSSVLSMDTVHTGAFDVIHHAIHVYSRDQLLPVKHTQLAHIAKRVLIRNSRLFFLSFCVPP